VTFSIFLFVPNLPLSCDVAYALAMACVADRFAKLPRSYYSTARQARHSHCHISTGSAGTRRTLACTNRVGGGAIVIGKGHRGTFHRQQQPQPAVRSTSTGRPGPVRQRLFGSSVRITRGHGVAQESRSARDNPPVPARSSPAGFCPAKRPQQRRHELLIRHSMNKSAASATAATGKTVVPDFTQPRRPPNRSSIWNSVIDAGGLKKPQQQQPTKTIRLHQQYCNLDRIKYSFHNA
jgi:hypothetical protein